ncbi:hypothetical protein EQF93_06660 [Helcococcus ovis]|uniref:hypothetical protein n=1 Tax=Helcococcus ovis TaxID=72026 RepID=UPI0010700DF6|nr:hypothetical protein [Helcococcus ovis]TFF66706.1 hypothetical protein EQF93_06660 [Helcococcus ovis]WNZ00847.1 hypothetical protein EQF90_006170 [Helcococcus ovis]
MKKENNLSFYIKILLFILLPIFTIGISMYIIEFLNLYDWQEKRLLFIVFITYINLTIGLGFVVVRDLIKYKNKCNL